jgi:uncharacterized membrane protein (UPF0127 family)
MLARRPGELTLRRDDGRIVAESVRVADTYFRRLRGLLGRRLRDGEGLVLRPAFSIHTSFMRYPIDVIFLDQDLKVVEIQSNVKPWRAASCRTAREVVELKAGEAERRGLREGDTVAWASVPTEAELAAAAAEVAPRYVGQTQGARVVVASRDRRFAKLMRFVLDRHGFEVVTASRDDLLELLERERANVVVLEASGSLVAAGQAAAAAKALHPEIEVVVVSEGGARGEQTTFRVFDKWDGMNDVVETVSRAVGTPVAG